MSRQSFNRLILVVAVVAGLYTLWIAAHDSGHLPLLSRRITKHVLLGAWALGPPAVLWFDWVYYGPGLSSAEREVTRHTHSLLRNLWIALVIILAIAFGLRLS